MTVETRPPHRIPPDGYEDGGHAGFYLGQGADLTPHLTYFDPRTQASFTWDGKSEKIEVGIGGYAEPVDHVIYAGRSIRELEQPAQSTVEFFGEICARHAATLKTF